MQKITPFLWFDDQAEEAANYYVSIFQDAKILSISRYAEGMPKPAGSVMMVSFQLEGQEYIALNGGPEFKFNEAISLFVNCATQAEVDHLWESLTQGGEEIQCGWLKDRYGVTWQIVPQGLNDLLGGPEPQRSARAAQAMFQMKKIDLDVMRAAYNQD